MYILGGLSYNSDGSYREAEGALQCTLTQIPGKCRAVVGETRLRICEGRGWLWLVYMWVGAETIHEKSGLPTTRCVCVCGGGGGGQNQRQQTEG